jgi:hypothetical protein
MSRVHRIFLTGVLLLTVIPVARLFAWKGLGEIAPMIEQVAPAEAVAGGIVTVTGFNLDPKHVSELYLNGRENGAEVHYGAEILTQTGLEISFRVPTNVPPGDFCIAMKLVGRAELVEAPLYLKIVGPVS